MLTKKELIEKLKLVGGTEKNLSDICEGAMNYIVIYPNTFLLEDFTPDSFAKIIVKCEDGYLDIPVYHYISSEGYEQLDLENVQSVNADEVAKYKDSFLEQIKIIDKILEF